METAEKGIVNRIAPTSRSLKYRLKETFTVLYGDEYSIKLAKDRCHIEKGIPISTLNADFNRRMVESTIIPDSRLQLYADFLAVTPAYLKADYLYWQSVNKTTT